MAEHAPSQLNQESMVELPSHAPMQAERGIGQ